MPVKVANLATLLGEWASGRRPRYLDLAEAIRAAIRRGDLSVGERLPAERILAHELGLSRTTVVAAYDVLRDEAWLASRRGSGTFVRRTSSARIADRRETRIDSIGGGPLYRGGVDDAGDMIQFTAAAIAPEDASLPELLAGATELVTELAHGHGYTAMGIKPLREAVAARMSDLGLPTDPDQVLITNGAQQAIALIAALHSQPGDGVLVENPTYSGALSIFRWFGLDAIPVALDDEGAIPEALQGALQTRAPRLVYLVPSFHNPTGSLMSESRRREIAFLLEEYDCPLVEDNTLTDLRLGQATPPPPIARYVAGPDVVTIGSLSKLFWGGLRIGWVRGPASVIARLAQLKTVLDLGTSLIGQAVAVQVLARGEELFQRRRTLIQRRADLLMSLLRRELPEWTFDEPAGGLSLWVRVPGVDTAEFAQHSLRSGVAIVSGAMCSPNATFYDHLRLPFTNREENLITGVDRLVEAWRTFRPRAVTATSIVG